MRHEHRVGQTASRRRAGRLGVGFYFRDVTELILFGVKGRLRTLEAGRRQVDMIESRKREHSRKPDEQHGLIESCSPGPYLELFAWYPREGWSAWGSEAAVEIEPKGKRYKGYEGGGIVLPAGLERGEASRDTEKV